MSKDGGGPVPYKDNQSGKLIPHGLLDVMDYVWDYHAAEKKGATYPEDLFTPKDMLEYSECGFVESLKSGLIGIVLTPIALGVIEKLIPIFGESNPSILDQLFSILLAMSYTLAYTFLLVSLTQKYIFPFTKRIIKNFLYGVIGGKIFIVFIAFFLYHYLYIQALTEENVVYVLLKMKFLMKGDRLNNVYQWIMDFRPVLLTSAWFMCFTALIFISVPLISIKYTVKKNRQITEEDL